MGWVKMKIKEDIVSGSKLDLKSVLMCLTMLKILADSI